MQRVNGRETVQRAQQPGRVAAAERDVHLAHGQVPAFLEGEDRQQPAPFADDARVERMPPVIERELEKQRTRPQVGDGIDARVLGHLEIELVAHLAQFLAAHGFPNPGFDVGAVVVGPQRGQQRHEGIGNGGGDG